MINSKTFFHPQLGVWAVVGSLPANMQSPYKPGTVQIPDAPEGFWSWNGAAWIQGPTPELVAPDLTPKQF
jgi:hypothetical protein